jgi:hypothetical protein
MFIVQATACLGPSSMKYLKSFIELRPIVILQVVVQIVLRNDLKNLFAFASATAT